MGISLILLMFPGLASAERVFQAGISETHYQSQTEREKGVVGINLEIRPQSYPVIMEVYPGTPAAQANLRVGDAIVTVDHLEVYDMSRVSVDAAISDVPGQPVRFMIQRDGRIFAVSLTVGGINRISRNEVRSLYHMEFGP